MSKCRKLSLLLVVLMVVSSVFTGCGKTQETSKTEENAGTSTEKKVDKNEKYYMVTFLSGIEYFKSCYVGFEDAGKKLGVKTVYTGTPEYDVNKQVTAFEQVVAKKPAGIAVACINPDALREPINKAIEQGVKVVTYDADSPDSNRLAFIATDNIKAGGVAADAMAQVLPEGGEVAVLTRPGQLNLEQRAGGFKDQLQAKYSNLNLVAEGNGKGDEAASAKEMSGIIQAHPELKAVFAVTGTEAVGAATAISESGKDIKVITFDADQIVLDMIKEDQIAATVVQGTYHEGYWALDMLYKAHHDLVDPVGDWKEKGKSPLPPYLDTGSTIVTKENADQFYVE
jgi:ribose transport system substrate-binding protein